MGRALPQPLGTSWALTICSVLWQPMKRPQIMARVSASRELPESPLMTSITRRYWASGTFSVLRLFSVPPPLATCYPVLNLGARATPRAQGRVSAPSPTTLPLSQRLGGVGNAQEGQRAKVERGARRLCGHLAWEPGEDPESQAPREEGLREGPGRGQS